MEQSSSFKAHDTLMYSGGSFDSVKCDSHFTNAITLNDVIDDNDSVYRVYKLPRVILLYKDRPKDKTCVS